MARMQLISNIVLLDVEAFGDVETGMILQSHLTAQTYIGLALVTLSVNLSDDEGNSQVSSKFKRLKTS